MKGVALVTANFGFIMHRNLSGIRPYCRDPMPGHLSWHLSLLPPHDASPQCLADVASSRDTILADIVATIINLLCDRIIDRKNLKLYMLTMMGIYREKSLIQVADLTVTHGFNNKVNIAGIII